MNNFQVEKVCSDISSLVCKFAGCFAADKIVLPNRFPSGCIFNTERESVSIGHWVAAWFPDASQTVLFFDPYGQPPNGDIETSLFSRYSSIVYNRHCHQRLTTNACGPFSIYFLYRCSMGWEFQDIVDRFAGMSDDDRYVETWLKRNFGVSV
jgi:hypothetical protein